MKLQADRKAILADAVVEIGIGSNVPPGTRGRQQTNVNRIWYRIDGGEWERSNFRTMFGLLEAVELAETLADFLELERRA